MKLYDCSQDAWASTGFPGGMDPQRAAAALRDLADRIDRQEVITHRLTMTERQEPDSFAFQEFTLRYSEKRAREGEPHGFR